MRGTAGDHKGPPQGAINRAPTSPRPYGFRIVDELFVRLTWSCQNLYLFYILWGIAFWGVFDYYDSSSYTRPLRRATLVEINKLSGILDQTSKADNGFSHNNRDSGTSTEGR